MPPEGGYELCRVLRARSAELPIIFLTARDSEIDEISGLRLGADDYLSKNISAAHLMARVTRLFQRNEALLGTDARTHRGEQRWRGACDGCRSRLHRATGAGIDPG